MQTWVPGGPRGLGLLPLPRGCGVLSAGHSGWSWVKWDCLPPGLYAGIKFFLIDFIFKRCPRLRAKYDTPYIIWKNLPTDPQLKERSSAAAVSRRVSPASSGATSAGLHSLSVTGELKSSRCHGALETT